MTLQVTLPATAWEPLPEGWILVDSTQVQHPATPTVPHIRNSFDCWAFIPSESFAHHACTRPHGHTGRHAVTVVTATPGVRQVVAVWSSTPSILEAVSTAIDDVTARHQAQSPSARDKAVSEAMDRVFDKDTDLLERLADS